MSPLASYKRLFDLAGAGYVLVAFLGRLPLAMSQLGALLLVSTATGSYGLGGLAAGALAVANALGAPVAGALADRVGQRPVVLVQSLLGATGLVALVAQVGGSTATTVLIAALAGLDLFYAPLAVGDSVVVEVMRGGARETLRFTKPAER